MWIGRINGSPQSRRTVGGNLEAIAPFVGVGEIAAIAIAARRLEIEGRGEHDEALGPGEPIEGDLGLLAYHAAPAVGADKISAGMRLDAVGSVHLDAHRAVSLRHV